jgi:hypothetical protein
VFSQSNVAHRLNNSCPGMRPDNTPSTVHRGPASGRSHPCHGAPCCVVRLARSNHGRETVEPMHQRRSRRAFPPYNGPFGAYVLPDRRVAVNRANNTMVLRIQATPRGTVRQISNENFSHARRLLGGQTTVQYGGSGQRNKHAAQQLIDARASQDCPCKKRAP